MTRLRGLAVAVVALALCVASSALVAARDRWTPVAVSDRRDLYLRSGRAARALAGPLDALAADLYWLRVVQHFGGDRLSHRAARPFELLQPLLDLTTTLDPHFTAAYRFGAIFLAEPPPGGPGRPDQAIALLEKGLAATPGRWQYAHDIGFVYLWSLGDPSGAAAWFRRAAAMPGAPNWLEPLAATTMAGADRRAATAWLTEMATHAGEAWIRRIAAHRLLQVRAMDEIDQLRAMVPVVQARLGRNPAGWDDFVAAGVLRAAPADPAGAPYVYFPASGMVRLSPASPLAPLPRLPGVPQ